MKVLLIAPPWSDIYRNYKDAAKLGCVSPPMGLVYLGGAIESSGNNCRIVDMEGEKKDLNDVKNIIDDYKPEIVGVTATTPIYNNAKKLGKYIKSCFPDIFLGIGGVHSTIMGKSVIEDGEFWDFQAIGEGEILIKELIAAVSGKISLKDIEGLIYRDKNNIIVNKPRRLIENLDNIPLPARYLLDDKIYQHAIPGKNKLARYAGLFTSRGCPFKCIFCSQHTMYGRSLRWHSIERILKELDYIVNKLGIKHVIVMDETMTIDRNRMIRLCREIKKRGLNFTFEGWTHVTTVDKELLIEMKSAGLIRLSFGIESGDPFIRNKIKKTGTLDQIREVYRIAHSVGLETRSSAILGHPFETKKSAWRTIKFISSIKECNQTFLNIACPYPGTELYEYAKNGIGGMELLDDDFSNYTRYGKPVIRVNNLSPSDLSNMQSLGLLYFYLKPGRIYYNLVKRAGIKAGIINAYAFAKGTFGNMVKN